MKNLLITHRQNGKKIKISWDGKTHPTEDHIDEIFAKEDHNPVKKAYDPLETTEHLRVKKVNVPAPIMPLMSVDNQDNDNKEKNDNSKQISDNEPESMFGDSSDETGKSTSDKDNEDSHFLKYHDSLINLSNDKENGSHLASSILHGRKAGVKPDEIEMDLVNSGVPEAHIKLAKELVRR